MQKQNKIKQAKKVLEHKPRAVTQYVLACIWFMVAIGNFLFDQQTVGMVFGGLGLVQLIFAFAIDIYETKKSRKEAPANQQNNGKKDKKNRQ